MDWWRKITDFIMPIEDVVVEVEDESVKKQETVQRSARQQVYEEKMAVNYGTVPYPGSYESQRETVAEKVKPVKPQLTVHTTKIPEMKVQVYVPTEYQQVVEMADDLKEKKSIVVNYDKVDKPLQRRICDFVNGVCYVSGGDARRITRSIVLYVPAGVDITDAEVMALVD